MKTKEFIDVFKGSIRVLMNWDRVEKEKWPVEYKVVDLEKLGSLLVPWSARGGMSDTERKPFEVSKVAKDLSVVSEKVRLDILKLSGDMPSDMSPLFPAMKVGKDILLLDGSHRAVALFLRKVPVSAVVAVMKPKGKRGSWDLEMMT